MLYCSWPGAGLQLSCRLLPLLRKVLNAEGVRGAQVRPVPGARIGPVATVSLLCFLTGFGGQPVSVNPSRGGEALGLIRTDPAPPWQAQATIRGGSSSQLLARARARREMPAAQRVRVSRDFLGNITWQEISEA